MKTTGLPARIVFAAVAFPLAGAAGFYLCMELLPGLVGQFPQLDLSSDGRGIFNLALGVSATLAVTLTLLVLTMPWSRHRKRSGRALRIAVSLVLVVVLSVWFADMGHRLEWDLLFAAWLTYTVAFTYVRYGVRDQERIRSVAQR